MLGKEKKEKDTSSDLYKIQDYERKMIELNMREEMIDLREQSLDEQFEEINSARLVSLQAHHPHRWPHLSGA